jgi:hypothetical protein
MPNSHIPNFLRCVCPQEVNFVEACSHFKSAIEFEMIFKSRLVMLEHTKPHVTILIKMF